MSVRVTTDVWENSTAGAVGLLVLLKLADCADEERRLAWPSVAHLAQRCRVSERTIQYTLRSLVASGDLCVFKPATRYSPTVYRVGCTSCTPVGPRGAERCTPGVQPIAPEPSVEPSKTPSIPPQVEQVWEAWMQATGKKRSKLDPKRRALIRRQLRVYSVEELVEAVQGWQKSRWHRGENPEGRTYNALELLLRDAEHVELFRDLQRGEAGSPADPTERLSARLAEARRNL